MMSQDFCFPFSVNETDVVPMKPRLHLRPNPHPRTRFRTVSAYISVFTPLPLVLPISIAPAFCPPRIKPGPGCESIHGGAG
jgi:hypothetical protein